MRTDKKHIFVFIGVINGKLMVQGDTFLTFSTLNSMCLGIVFLTVFFLLDECTSLLPLDIDSFLLNLFILVTFLMCRMIYSYDCFPKLRLFNLTTGFKIYSYISRITFDHPLLTPQNFICHSCFARQR